MNGHCCDSVSRIILTSLPGWQNGTVSRHFLSASRRWDGSIRRPDNFVLFGSKAFDHGIADDRSWFGRQRIRPRNRSQTRYGSLPIVATFTLSDRRWRWSVRQSIHPTTFVARKPGIHAASRNRYVSLRLVDIPSREAGEFFQSRR